jgi:DNA-binding MarR family transcriptional regulator
VLVAVGTSQQYIGNRHSRFQTRLAAEGNHYADFVQPASEPLASPLASSLASTPQDAIQDRSPEAGALTHAITRLRRALRRSIRSDYPWESLPMAQVEVLLCLNEHTQLRVGEVATLLRLAPNTTSGLVQQVVSAGLAERSPDPADRRVSTVSLTDPGRDQLRDWTSAHESRIGRALTRLSIEDQAAVRAALPALERLAGHLTSDPEA